MPRLTRLHSFLDRFEERLEVNCERLKRQLLAQVDQQFGVLRTKVRQLRIRFSGDCPGTVDPMIDDPPVETVSLDQCIREQQQDTALVNQASTCTGRKRKLPTGQFGGARKRTAQASTNASNRKCVCNFVGCGKSFISDIRLAQHERIHLDTRPFICTWPACGKASRKRNDLREHIRIVHFKLPKRAKQQQQLNIIDDRDPNQYIRVDTDQLNRHQS